jgi:hypothetical protein
VSFSAGSNDTLPIRMTDGFTAQQNSFSARDRA